MIRVLVVILAVGLGAIAWVLLLPTASQRPKVVATAPATTRPVDQGPPAATADSTAPVSTGHEIRVVYPGPDGTAGVHKLADKVDTNATATPTMVPAAPAPVSQPSSVAAPPSTSSSPVATTPPQTASVTPPATDPATTAPPPTAGQTVNINTASIEALNQIPGAGRIGRTIASHRPYASIEELVRKRVLKKSLYDRIKDQIATN